MKLQSLVVATAVAVAAVSAAECTDEQFTTVENANGPALEKACPSLFTDSGSVIDPTHLDSFTTDSLKALSSCKDKNCITALKSVMALLPDCTAVGINVKALYGGSVTLCEGFGNDTITVDKAKEIFKDVAKNVSSALDQILTDGSKNPLKEILSDKSNDTEKTSTPASSSPVPTTTKSSANTMTVAGVAIFTTAAASMLL